LVIVQRFRVKRIRISECGIRKGIEGKKCEQGGRIETERIRRLESEKVGRYKMEGEKV